MIGLAPKDPDCVEVLPEAGVYEVREPGAEACLTIGKGCNVRRIRRQLVLGTGKHWTGKRMRVSEDLSRLEVRWAATDRPCAVEQVLHKRHVARFGRSPKYTKGTRL